MAYFPIMPVICIWLIFSKIAFTVFFAFTTDCETNLGIQPPKRQFSVGDLFVSGPSVLPQGMANLSS